MYEGYVTFGGREVINTERLQAYVDHGIVPPGVEVTACADCDGLAEALDPDLTPYRTPILDAPEWVDLNNPDTFDFTGLLPLEITGLEGSTATVTMTETLEGRAIPGRRQGGVKQVGVTALLTGRTTEGVKAGLRWLTSLLQRTCEDDPGCAGGAPLELFDLCPTPIYDQPDLTADQLEDVIDGWVEPDGGWTPVNGDYVHNTDPLYGDTAGVFTPYSDAVIDGGTPETTFDPPLDGGTPETTVDPPADGGDPGPFTSDAQGMLWRDTGLGPVCGPTTLRFVLIADDDPVNVTLVLLDPQTGAIIEYGPQVSVSDTETDGQAWVFPDGIDYEAWAVGFIADRPIINLGVIVEHFPSLSPEACIAPYRRILPGAVLTSGPTITERLAVADCAEWFKVEWIWTTNSRYKYGTPERLITDQGALVSATFEAVGVSGNGYGYPTPLSSGPWNCEPESDTISCAVDPCNPGWAAPPSPPVIADPTFAVLTGSANMMGASVCIDPSIIPDGEGVLTIKLASDDRPKVGVRVRIYDQVEGTCVETDKCEWLAEYLIDYIPADGIVTIDGVDGTITTLCAEFPDPQPTVVRGDYGGPVKDPVVGCGRRLLIQVQWFRDYPRGCTGFYNIATNEGDLLISVDLSTRED